MKDRGCQCAAKVRATNLKDRAKGNGDLEIVMDGDRIVHVVELKCPEWAAHWGYIQTGTIGKDYVAQICHGFMVTGCESLDWMSYHPDYPEKLQHVLIPHLRADWQSEIDAYAKAAAMFMAEVEAFARELETRAA